jgi:glycosyltransferase involved in cell wall biosynthesis
MKIADEWQLGFMNKSKMPRLLRVTTVPISLKLLLKGQPQYFTQQGFEVLTVSADGPEVHHLRASGIAHTVVPMTRQITPFQDLISLFRLVLIIRQFKPDIIHSHTPKAGLLGMLAGWLCRVPLRMHTIAGLPWMESTGAKRWLLKKMEWLTYACSTRVYPNSRHMKDFLHQQLSFQEHKTKLIGSGSSNGIDVTFFSRAAIGNAPPAIRQQLNIPPSAWVFCFVGRLVRDKGIVELIEAFESLSNEAWLMLVGHMEPELDPLPNETLVKIRLNPRIVQAGFQSDVRPWLAASNAFVFPSYREGFPNVVMQAACMELPSIVTDINGSNEIIQQGKSGVIVPVKDAIALRDAMQDLALDEQQAVNMGRTGRAFVEANFSQSVIWQVLLTEYTMLLKR